MNIIVTGATGMVGSEVVRQAIADPAMEQISLLIRRPSAFRDKKVTELIHSDFTNFSALRNNFSRADACIWCLGISQSRVSRHEYFRITYEYTVAAAREMLAANPAMIFIFLSGEGADSTEKSRVRFAKVKGQAENALMKMHPESLYIFRPGGILPTTRDPEEGAYKKFEITMVRLMAALLPWSVVTTRQLSYAMLKIAKEGYPKTIIGHKEIKSIP